MPRELTAEDREDLTPGELAALMGEDTEAAAAAALADATAASTGAERASEEAADKEGVKKPAAAATDDDDLDEATRAAAEAAKTAAAAEGDEEEDDELSADALQAVVNEAEAKPVAPKPVTYKGVSDADYKTKAGEIDTAVAAGLKQLLEGEIDAEAYAAILSAQNALRDELVAQRTLSKANEQAAAQRAQDEATTMQAGIEALMKESDKDGAPINYVKDLKAQKQFDMALQQLGADPDNSGKSAAWAIAEADRVVRALRGIAGTPAAAPAAPTPPAKPGKRDVPITLAGLPSAAPNQVGADLRAQFMTLDAEDAEEFLARLPAVQRRALLQGEAV